MDISDAKNIAISQIPTLNTYMYITNSRGAMSICRAQTEYIVSISNPITIPDPAGRGYFYGYGPDDVRYYNESDVIKFINSLDTIFAVTINDTEKTGVKTLYKNPTIKWTTDEEFNRIKKMIDQTISNMK